MLLFSVNGLLSMLLKLVNKMGASILRRPCILYQQVYSGIVLIRIPVVLNFWIVITIGFISTHCSESKPTEAFTKEVPIYQIPEPKIIVTLKFLMHISADFQRKPLTRIISICNPCIVVTRNHGFIHTCRQEYIGKHGKRNLHWRKDWHWRKDCWEKKTNHSLRATGVSNMFQAGLPIQQWTRHHSFTRSASVWTN